MVHNPNTHSDIKKYPFVTLFSLKTIYTHSGDHFMSESWGVCAIMREAKVGGLVVKRNKSVNESLFYTSFYKTLNNIKILKRKTERGFFAL